MTEIDLEAMRQGPARKKGPGGILGEFLSLPEEAQQAILHVALNEDYTCVARREHISEHGFPMSREQFSILRAYGHEQTGT